MSSLLFLLSLALLAAVAHADLREIWWNISYTTANPDGLQPRRVIGVNASWPPPPVELASNDTLRLHAFNGLDVPTALHHHGLFFNHTPWSDGAMGVTQCGIPPGQSLTYDIPVQDWNQWGTYWVHAHAKGQYVDGLRAPLVIHNAAGEVHAYDDEYTVIVSDWYHTQVDDLLADFLSIKNPRGAEPVPDSALIYFTHAGSYLPGFNQNANLTFSAGKTYRLRIVNTSAFAMIYFWIDGHDMRIIEVDGTDVQEHQTSALTVAVAQRYSVLVTARNDTTVRNFVVHANMDTTMFDKVPDGVNPNATASIIYDPSAPLAPAPKAPEFVDVNDTALVPVVPEPLLPQPDRIVDLHAFFATFDNGVNRASFNNVTYNTPLVPSLLSMLSMGNNSVNPEIYGPNSFVLQYNEVVEIRVHNWDAGKHPFHLHGHKFQLVHKSEDVTSTDQAANPPVGSVEGSAVLNPMRRDTVNVPGLGNAFLRVRADNPGAWLFHCHIEWHLASGLAVTFLSAPLELQAASASSNPAAAPPSTLASHCAALGQPSAGNAAGHTDPPTDLHGLPVGPFPQRLGWRPRAIGAMVGCVAAALGGMAAVVWYVGLGAVGVGVGVGEGLGKMDGGKGGERQKGEGEGEGEGEVAAVAKAEGEKADVSPVR